MRGKIKHHPAPSILIHCVCFCTGPVFKQILLNSPHGFTKAHRSFLRSAMATAVAEAPEVQEPARESLGGGGGTGDTVIIHPFLYPFATLKTVAGKSQGIKKQLDKHINTKESNKQSQKDAQAFAASLEAARGALNSGRAGVAAALPLCCRRFLARHIYTPGPCPNLACGAGVPQRVGSGSV